jgi:hypothetical protein
VPTDSANVARLILTLAALLLGVALIGYAFVSR